MADTKLKKLDETLDQVQSVLDRTLESAEVLGALKSSLRLSEGLNGHAFREFARWLKDKRYQDIGFKTELDFLASHRSPMSKSQFFERKNVFAKEGEELFDLLNAVNVPLSTRKLLGKGDDVRIEGKHLVIGEARVRRDDWDGIARAFKLISDKADEQTRTIERGRKENKNLKKKLETEKAQPALTSTGNPFFGALLNVCGSFSLLAAEAERLSPEERDQRRKKVFKTIGEQLLRLDEAFGIKVPDSVKRASKGAPAELLDGWGDDD